MLDFDALSEFLLGASDCKVGASKPETTRTVEITATDYRGFFQ